MAFMRSRREERLVNREQEDDFEAQEELKNHSRLLERLNTKDREKLSSKSNLKEHLSD